MANTSSERRVARVRRAVRRAAKGRPRLSVFRSSKHIYAQIIDDTKGHTIAAASSRDKDLSGTLKTGADAAAAGEVGKLIAARATAAGIKDGQHVTVDVRGRAVECEVLRPPFVEPKTR